MSNIPNTYRKPFVHGASYALCNRFLDPTPPPQHIADAVAAGVELDADWLEEIEQLRTQEATSDTTREF